MSAKRYNLKQAVHFLRNADEISFLLTGSRLSSVGKRALDVFCEDLKKTARRKLAELWEEANIPISPDSPYGILHCRPEFNDVVIKARYRMLVKELHPDTGTRPDPKEFQRVVEAYDFIMKQRNGRKKGADSL